MGARQAGDAAQPPLLTLSGDQHVLQHRQPREHARQLEGATDAEPEHTVRRAVGDVLAPQADLALLHALITGDDVEERRLARAVRADQAVDLTLVDLECTTVQRLDAAVGLDHPADLDQGAHRVAPAIPASSCSPSPSTDLRLQPPTSEEAADLRHHPTRHDQDHGQEQHAVSDQVNGAVGEAEVRYCCSDSSTSAPNSGPTSVPSPPKNAINAIERSNSGSYAVFGIHLADVVEVQAADHRRRRTRDARRPRA